MDMKWSNKGNWKDQHRKSDS